MDLNQSNEENMTFMLNEIVNKLGVANKSLFNPKDYDLAKYSKLKEMHELVDGLNSLSPLETQAFLDELKHIRK